jgi:hypothetical protein
MTKTTEHKIYRGVKKGIWHIRSYLAVFENFGIFEGSNMVKTPTFQPDITENLSLVGGRLMMP